jgi:serine O-acetyltransferase
LGDVNRHGGAGGEPAVSLADLIRADYAAFELRPLQALSGLLTLSLFWLIFLHRLSHWLQQRKVPLLPAVLRSVGLVLYAADLSPGARIGPGFRIVHGVGVVVGWDVEAGPGLLLYQSVTLGGRGRVVEGKWCPSLGANVTVGAGAVVLGPIHVGDSVSIGANSVVIESVPDGARVAGNPGRIIN